MADLFLERRDFASANSLYRQLLEDSDKMGTISRPVKLTILNNYGTSFLYETLSTRSLSIEEKLARFQQVEKIFRNSCEISEQLLGPDYPKHLITRFNLANICFIQGESDRLQARANPAKMAESLDIKLDTHRRCLANKLTSHNIYVENCYGLARHYDHLKDLPNFEKYTKAGLEAGSKFMPETNSTMIKLRNYKKRINAQ